MHRELPEEERVAQFRRVVSTYPRVADDELGRYLNRLDEKDVEVRNRLDSISRTSKIELTAEKDGEWLVLVAQYRARGASEATSGTVRCRFPEPIASFLLHAVRDLPEPRLGSGRLMAKIRAVLIPRFDDDWDAHLAKLSEIVSKLAQHESRVASLRRAISDCESEVDRLVYDLYGLRTEDIQRIEVHHAGIANPTGDDTDNNAAGILLRRSPPMPERREGVRAGRRVSKSIRTSGKPPGAARH